MKNSKIVFMEEFQYVKHLEKNVPELIKKLDKCKEMLYSHSDFSEVTDILGFMDEAQVSLAGLLEVYHIKLNGVNNNE